MRLRRSSFLAVLVAAAPAGAAHGPRVVRPTDSVQAALDAARPGDRILVFGTHRENVAVQKDGLTVRGVGAVLEPPAMLAVGINGVSFD